MNKNTFNYKTENYPEQKISSESLLAKMKSITEETDTWNKEWDANFKNQCVSGFLYYKELSEKLSGTLKTYTCEDLQRKHPKYKLSMCCGVCHEDVDDKGNHIMTPDGTVLVLYEKEFYLLCCGSSDYLKNQKLPFDTIEGKVRNKLLDLLIH